MKHKDLRTLQVLQAPGATARASLFTPTEHGALPSAQCPSDWKAALTISFHLDGPLELAHETRGIPQPLDLESRVLQALGLYCATFLWV